MRARFGSAAALGSAIIIAGCTSGSASPGATTGGAAAVDVTLQEWAVIATPGSVAAGEVTFNVTNTGPEDVHEFVIVKTDLDPGALPTDDTGAVTEGAAGIEVVDEIEDIPVGGAEELTVSLGTGAYVLLCNIYSEEEDEAHYKLGMRIGFTVTE